MLVLVSIRVGPCVHAMTAKRGCRFAAHSAGRAPRGEGTRHARKHSKGAPQPSQLAANLQWGEGMQGGACVHFFAQPCQTRIKPPRGQR